MKVAFTGPRNLALGITEIAYYVQKSSFKPTEILVGDARGVDAAVRRFAVFHFPTAWTKYEAYWDKYNKSAGPIRNMSMIADADALIAFVRDDGKPVSSGTASAIAEAVVKGIPIYTAKV